jgi:hypothetical protein
MNDACKIVWSTNHDTTGLGGNSQGIDFDRKLRRKLRVRTVGGGDAGLREERNTELTTNKKSAN